MSNIFTPYLKNKQLLFLLQTFKNQLNKKNEIAYQTPQLILSQEQEPFNNLKNKQQYTPRIFVLYNALNSILKTIETKKDQKTLVRFLFLVLEEKRARFFNEKIDQRKVYQSLYLKQTPLQLTELYITSTPQFKDSLAFTKRSKIQNTLSKQLNLEQTSLLLNERSENQKMEKNQTNLKFYNLFIKSYATEQSSDSDHIAYDFNTINQPNFLKKNIGIFLRKKRQILHLNKNISSKKIKKLYQNWYKFQLTRTYLTLLRSRNKTKKNPIRVLIKQGKQGKTLRPRKRMKLSFFTFAKQQTLNSKKLQLLKKNIIQELKKK